jgi:hypothetical protein
VADRVVIIDKGAVQQIGYTRGSPRISGELLCRGVSRPRRQRSRLGLPENLLTPDRSAQNRASQFGALVNGRFAAENTRCYPAGMFRVLLGVALLWGMMVQSLTADGGGGCGDGGGAGFGGFGGDSGPLFAVPRVVEDVNVGGLTLELDREKWGYSVLGSAREGALARFVGEDIEVTLRRLAPAPVDGEALVESLASRNDVLYVRPVATSGALRGVKAAFGTRRGHSPRQQTAVRYFIAVSDRGWLCFEARPTGKTPQWRDANDLILGARLDRS